MSNQIVNNGISELIKLGIKTIASDNLNDNISNLINSSMSSANLWTPSYDIIDNNEHMVIYLEIPSVKPDSIKLEFLNNKLSIYGDKVKPYEGFPSQGEILYGKFGKVISLPVGVTSQNKVETKVENGMLEVKILKLTEQTQKFSVTIN